MSQQLIGSLEGSCAGPGQDTDGVIEQARFSAVVGGHGGQPMAASRCLRSYAQAILTAAAPPILERDLHSDRLYRLHIGVQQAPLGKDLSHVGVA